MTSLEQLIGANFSVPEGDAAENADLAKVRAALNATIQRDASSPGRYRRRGRGMLAPLRVVPLVLASVGALLIAVVALTVLRPHGSSSTLSGPPAGPGAAALIHRLAVLRRPQTAGDKLPAHLVFNRAASGLAIGARSPVIIPSLSRLVATLPDASVYIAVTTPERGPDAGWNRSYGDLVTIISITPKGTTESPGLPAAALSDSDLLVRAGLIPALTGKPLKAATATGAYGVAIVPDGVARVRWVFADRAGGAGRIATVRVTNNVALIALDRATGVLLRGTWYAADGGVVPTSDAALTRAVSERQAARTRQALAQAERQHVRVPARLLAAFAVFSFNSPTGTRTPDGYVISHPTLTQLPSAVLSSPGAYPLDLRQTRRVLAPSGLQMWVVPGQNGICVFEIDPPNRLPYGRITHSAGGGCSGNLKLAIQSGAGVDADNQTGAIQYGVIPKTRHSVTIQITQSTHRTIHPADGVYITSTPFHFG